MRADRAYHRISPQDVPVNSKIRLVSLAGTVLAAFALGLTAAPASAHRLDLAVAKEVAFRFEDTDFVEGCDRVTDHRVSCWWYNDTGDLDAADFVLIGSRLYKCNVERPCTKAEK